MYLPLMFTSLIFPAAWVTAKVTLCGAEVNTEKKASRLVFSWKGLVITHMQVQITCLKHFHAGNGRTASGEIDVRNVDVT